MFIIFLLSMFSWATLASSSSDLLKFCESMEDSFKKNEWDSPECLKYKWNYVRKSNKGVPLAWVVFGDEKTQSKNVTMILCGVHGDEITPVKFCFDIMKELDQKKPSEHLVIISPLVSPDSFFIDKPTRTNSRGVDINRNFPTKDWKAKALKSWSEIYKKDKRRFPGDKASSEPEVVFQMNLIKRYQPKKIISVHAPLTLLDYDGPGFESSEKSGAKELLLQMSQKAEGYKVSNYPHFPGSLGNWAGVELKIPTYTLELPNTNPKESNLFYEKFKNAIHLAIEHPIEFQEKSISPEASLPPKVEEKLTPPQPDKPKDSPDANTIDSLIEDL